jgi:hypothetical protein
MTNHPGRNGEADQTVGASALSIIQHQGMPYVSVSDLAGALAHMVAPMDADAEQRKPLAMLHDVFLQMLQPSVKKAPQILAHACQTCLSPVVTLEALGEAAPVTVEVRGAVDGAWVPVDRPDGSTWLVPWSRRLDGARMARVHTHVCATS